MGLVIKLEPLDAVILQELMEIEQERLERANLTALNSYQTVLEILRQLYAD